MSLNIRDIPELKAQLEPSCRRFEVSRLDLVGSAACGDFDPEASDLDFLVTFNPTDPASKADRYFGLLEALEAESGYSVDLLEEKALTNPVLIDSFRRTRIPLYAA